jgi:hypothetical protein
MIRFAVPVIFDKLIFFDEKLPIGKEIIRSNLICQSGTISPGVFGIIQSLIDCIQ